VDREHRDAQARRVACGPFHRVGDVVELEVQEHRHAELADLGNQRRPVRAERLQADLGDTHPTQQRTRQA